MTLEVIDMAKKATSKGKVKISYVKVHKEMKALAKQVQKAKKARPHSTRLKVLESKIRAFQKLTECQKVMVEEL